MRNSIEYIFCKFPEGIKRALFSMPDYVKSSIEEIRIKVNGPIVIYASGKEYFLNSDNIFTISRNNNRLISKEELMNIFNSILNYSVYAHEEELSNGYITIQGGHRVGLCGKVVMEEGKVKTIKNISSLNIRRSREIIGISEKIIQYIFRDSKSIYNTLIVSPPKCGKTTLLRDLVRNLSERGFKIGVVDERSEIAGMFEGIAQNDLGIRTDIMDGCPKEKGIIMMIRSMSPDIIATDEIGKEQDVYAVEAALNAGINLITTIHGYSYEDLEKSNIKKLICQGIFNRLVFLSNIPKTGSIKSIVNEYNQIII